MTTISLIATDQLLAVALKPKIASGDQNSVELHVDFDSMWDGYGKSAVFYTSDDPDTIYEIPLTNGSCGIPHEVLTKPGVLYIGVRGVNSDNNAVKTSSLVKYKIVEGAPAGDGTTVDPTADVYQQLLTAYGKTDAAIVREVSDREAADATEKAERQAEIAVERARINQFTALPNGSTTGDAELAGIRVGFDGKTHPNAGEAVRGQVRGLYNKIQPYFSLNPVVTDSIEGVLTVDFDTQTINFPHCFVIYQGKFIDINAQAMDFSAINTAGVHIYCNIETRKAELHNHNYAPTPNDIQIAILVFDSNHNYVRSVVSNLPVRVLKNNVYYTSFTPIVNALGTSETSAVSQDLFSKRTETFRTTAGVMLVYDNQYLTIDTENKKVSIPDAYFSKYGGYIRVTGTDVDYSGVSSEGVMIWYNQSTGEYRAESGSAPNPSHYDVLVVAFCRLNHNQVIKNVLTTIPYQIVQNGVVLSNVSRLADETGQSTSVGMTQKAITDAIQKGINDATTYSAIEERSNVKTAAHRGYSAVAPENTLPAYKAAVSYGFTTFETDIQFTSDGVAVCIHDTTVDRTSNGTGNVADMTLEQLQALDFGSWFSAVFAGTKIMTFEEYLQFLKATGTKSALELKAGTDTQIQGLVDMVKKYRLEKYVKFTSFNPSFLRAVHSYDETMSLTLIVSSITDSDVSTILGLKSSNDVSIASYSYTEAEIGLCKANGLPLEIWTIDTESIVLNMDSYISGVISNTLLASRVLYDNAMNI